MFNKIFFSCLLVMFPVVSFAQDQSETNLKPVQIVPLVQYENLSLESQNIQSSSAGLQIIGTDVQFIGLYTQHVFKEPLNSGFPRRYHTIDVLLDGKNGRNQYLGIFKSESDKPVSGGIDTYQAAGVYGYEVIQKPNFSFVLGGGLAVGNFGIETDDGENWPVIPVPLVRLNYHSDWLEAKFEFLTSPNISFTLAPKDRIRLTGDIRMDQFRDTRDIIFEVALAYRPFSNKNEMGDYTGIALGFKNDHYGPFKLGNKEEEESIEVHYYSLFAEFDISVLKITAGYAFGGRSLYNETDKLNLKEGSYVSVQGMFPF
ncbi:MAG: hypothetical protein HQL71_10215 [Magnetococcales bacterium]|nr:hypothetical protein [Magnetococcales bacterium]